MGVAKTGGRGRRVRRRRPMPPLPPPDPIDAFWLWWSTARAPLAAAIESRAVDEWVPRISEQVRAVHPKLAWELGPGVKSAHHLCVSADGDAGLRVTTERWLSRAPAPDALWEYYPAKQPRPRGDAKLTLRLGEVDLAYADVRFALHVHPIRRVVHVVVFHPKLHELDEARRGLATMLFLDDVLGEDGTERWLGDVRHTLDSSEASDDRDALFAATETLASRARDQDFTLLEGRAKDGGRKLAVVNLGIKRLDHLLMESHLEVTITYPAAPNGFYESEAVGEELKAMEDALLEALGKDAVYIGHETGVGRRVIHLHVATSGPAQQRLTEWERAYPKWDIETTARADPRWDVLGRW
jgi:hypothetical protein